MSETSPKTVDSIVQNFFYDFNKRSQSQHANLIKHLEAFIIAYSDLNTPEYRFRLDKIKYSPVNYFISKNPAVWSYHETKQLERGFLLSDLDFIYFRDSSFINDLKRSYLARYTKSRRYHSKITLSQIAAVLNFVREELYKDLVRFSCDKHFSINVYLPETTQTVQVQQVGY